MTSPRASCKSINDSPRPSLLHCPSPSTPLNSAFLYLQHTSHVLSPPSHPHPRTPTLIPMSNTLLHRQHRLFQLPNPTTNPPLHLLRHPRIAPQNSPIKLQQLVQFVPRSRPVVRSIRRILLRLLGGNLEFVPRGAVEVGDLLDYGFDLGGGVR